MVGLVTIREDHAHGTKVGMVKIRNAEIKGLNVNGGKHKAGVSYDQN